MTTVQNIAKQLNKAGLKKASFERVNFQNVPTGHYEAKHLKCFGMNTIVVTPMNGMTCERIQQILSNEKTEVRNGIVVII